MTDPPLIDRIVQGVLAQLGTRAAVLRPDAGPQATTATDTQAPEHERIEIADRVVTADLLAESVNGARTVVVRAEAIVTPAAVDYLRDRGLRLQRARQPQAGSGAARESTGDSVGRPLLVVVRSTEAVERVWDDLKNAWRRELLGCPDDAAKLAIGALARGETTTVVIMAEQTHRAACLANRHESAKAVAVRDASDVKRVRRQLRANVWCLDPTPMSWFELRNVIREVVGH